MTTTIWRGRVRAPAAAFVYFDAAERSAYARVDDGGDFDDFRARYLEETSAMVVRKHRDGGRGESHEEENKARLKAEEEEDRARMKAEEEAKMKAAEEEEKARLTRMKAEEEAKMKASAGGRVRN